MTIHYHTMPMTHSQRQARRRAIAEFIERGGSVKQAACHWNVSKSMVRKAVMEHQVPINPLSQLGPLTLKVLEELEKGSLHASAIASKYNISRQRVGQIKKKALILGYNLSSLPKGPVLVQQKRQCPYCGNEFLCTLGARKVFCSQRCAGLSQCKPEKPWSRHGKVLLTCSNCGEPFERTSNIEKACSQRCSNPRHSYCSFKCYLSRGKHELKAHKRNLGGNPSLSST